jgi:hypothetical protein
MKRGDVEEVDRLIDLMGGSGVESGKCGGAGYLGTYLPSYLR